MTPSPSFRIRLVAWLLLVLYLGLAVTMTHLPKLPTELADVSDKSLHVAGYAVYGALLYIALGLTFPRARFLWLIVPAILAVWAGLDELTQPYFGRSCDILDWRADMLGVCGTVAALSGLRWLFDKRTPTAPAV